MLGTILALYVGSCHMEVRLEHTVTFLLMIGDIGRSYLPEVQSDHLLIATVGCCALLHVRMGSLRQPCLFLLDFRLPIQHVVLTVTLLEDWSVEVLGYLALASLGCVFAGYLH